MIAFRREFSHAGDIYGPASCARVYCNQDESVDHETLSCQCSKEVWPEMKPTYDIHLPKKFFTCSKNCHGRRSVDAWCWLLLNRSRRCEMIELQFFSRDTSTRRETRSWRQNLGKAWLSAGLFPLLVNKIYVMFNVLSNKIELN